MRHSLSTICFLLAFATLTSAFYESGSKVIKLTAANFREKVIQSNEVWFVEFYAPWCGHCKNLAPEWDKLAKGLDGIIRVGAVDMTTDQAAGEKYGIRGFPTIKFFGADKNAPVDYQGQRTAKDMMDFAFSQARKAADARLGGSSSGGSSYQSGGSAGGSCGGGGGSGFGAGGNTGGSCGGGGSGSGSGSGGNVNDGDVVVLTDSNFDQNVMNSEDLWIVEFYAPWCGHCKRLEPEWSRAATELKGQVKLGKVDATVHSSLASRFNVNGYPTIKAFPPGSRGDSSAQEYDGGRETSSIVSWALEYKSKVQPAVKVVQLYNPETFEKYCTNLRGVCLIAFLPHILDSSASERNSYIEVLQELSKSNRGNPVTFLWSQAGDYYSIEESLGLGSGYPSVVAISVNKMKYAPLTGAFDKKNVEVFIRNLLAGKQPLFNLREVPKIKNVAQWDGKNAKAATTDDL